MEHAAQHSAAKRQRRKAAPLSFDDEGRAGRAGRTSMVEDGAMERLAKRLVLGKLGPMVHPCYFFGRCAALGLPGDYCWGKAECRSGIYRPRAPAAL